MTSEQQQPQTNRQSVRRRQGGERVGPTLSTSTSSFEALDPHDPQLNQLASLMFTKTADWISSELESTYDEYKLVQQMNRYALGFFFLFLNHKIMHLLGFVFRATAGKYSDMQQITGNIAKGVNQLNGKYEELQPYLDQIDQIDESVERLYQAAVKLESYSKRLESKYKELEKRNS